MGRTRQNRIRAERRAMTDDDRRIERAVNRIHAAKTARVRDRDHRRESRHYSNARWLIFQ